MKRRRLAEYWNEFSVDCMSRENLSADACWVLKHAFYSGAMVMFESLRDVAPMGKEAMRGVVEDYIAELKSYAASLPKDAGIQ